MVGRKIAGLTALIACFCNACQSNANDLVTIALEGQIEPECQLIALPSTVDIGQLSTSGSQLIPFTIDCNAPFSYHVRSQQGGLSNTSETAQSPGFTNLVRYVLEVRIPTDESLILDQCDSIALVGATPDCTFTDSGNAISISQTASLQVSWSTSDELIAGPYSDVLTLTVQARL